MLIFVPKSNIKMESFCDNILEYIMQEESITKIVALTFRDIFLNELIYIEYFDIWKQYDTNVKIWNAFKVNEFHGKIIKLKQFFETSLSINFKNSDKYKKMSSMELFFVEREIHTIIKYMTTIDGEKEIIEECKKYFNIQV